MSSADLQLDISGADPQRRGRDRLLDVGAHDDDRRRGEYDRQTVAPMPRESKQERAGQESKVNGQRTSWQPFAF
jgi:hypothetical protein